MTRKIRMLLLWGLVLFVFLPGVLLANESPSIVVWRLEAKEGVTEKNVDSISGVLAAEVERRSGRKVISEADIKTVLSGEETKQQCGAESTSCIAEIGAALGAPEAVAGDLGRIGSYWVLNLRRINIRTVEVINRISRRIKGGEDELIEELPYTIAGLFGCEIPAKDTKSVEIVETESYSGLGTLSKIGIGLMSTGAAMLIVGGIATWKTGQAKDDYEKTLSQSAKDDHESWKSASYAMYGIGGAALVTGAALLIVDQIRDKPDNPQTARLDMGAAPMPDGAQVTLLVRW